jgi:hypothetical protein
MCADRNSPTDGAACHDTFAPNHGQRYRLFPTVKNAEITADFVRYISGLVDKYKQA